MTPGWSRLAFVDECPNLLLCRIGKKQTDNLLSFSIETCVHEYSPARITRAVLQIPRRLVFSLSTAPQHPPGC